MKLTIRPDSTNYACTVVKLPVKQKVEGLDKLVKVTIFGNDVLTQKDTDETCLYLFFPAECQISAEYLSTNNEFRHTNLNKDQSAKPGFFEDNGRVKAIKFKGIISTGYLAPISTLNSIIEWWSDLNVGDEFTDIDGINICKKYKVVHQQSTTTTESKHNKKLKKFSKLVPNQFRFHLDTSHLAKNLHVFHPEDIIVITDKWHGTSSIHSNILVNKKLGILDKIAKFIGINIVTTEYGNLYSSRKVIQNETINPNTNNYYQEGKEPYSSVNKELEGKIEQGTTLYGEIVGHMPSGKHIQKGYDYGCRPETIIGEQIPANIQGAEHKFLVYRITYTKPDGNVIEFSWQQIKDYCKKYELEHVKELYFGPAKHLLNWTILTSGMGTLEVITQNNEKFQEEFFRHLSVQYLEKDCKWCVNKVPAEGIVVRKDGLESYSAYKLKSKRFLERETEELDKGEINIEDEQVT